MRNVAIIDSGMGGLALLRRLYYSMPANYIYFADTLNFPYGDKNRQQLQYIAEHNVLTLLEKYNIDTVIVACNTLSVAALPYLKKLFDGIHFVGCEPPIKQVLQYTAAVPLLVATPFTVEHLKTTGQIDWMLSHPLPELATMVENGTPLREVSRYIERELAPYSNFDCIALGCTHYSLVKSNFEQLFPAVKIFDSVDGAYSKVKKLYRKGCCRESTLEFVFTHDPDNNLKAKYEKIVQEIFKYY